MDDNARPAKARYSVARVRNHWYVAVASDRLKTKPLSRTILDTPLVLFRDDQGTATALLDRCAHRNVPLSLGSVRGGRLVCGYHGWAYDGDGMCRDVPALCGEPTGRARRVQRYPTQERDGFVWVFMAPELLTARGRAEQTAPAGRAEQPVREVGASVPPVEPFSFPHLDDPAYTTVRYTVDVPATLHATLENILDVPHTAFLHRGLFRADTRRNSLTAVIRRTADRAEARFIGEPRPAGLVGRLMSPGGGEVEHVDRFILPSIAQVEYRLGPRNHVVVTSALTPITDFETRLYAVATFRTLLWDRAMKALLTPIGMAILEQDRRMLRKQTESVRRFGGEQYASTDVDLLGPHIWRLLRQAERGDTPSSEVFEQRVPLLT